MKSFLVYTIVLFAFSITTKGQEHFFRQYTTEEGLNDSFIYSVNQDNDGYLWIGTAEGLNRFNGFDVENFTSETGLSDNYISKIFRDSKGVLWFGHRNGSVTIRSDRDLIVPDMGLNNKGLVVDIAEDDMGIIWLCLQNQGLFYLNEKQEVIEVEHQFEFEMFSSIMPLSDNYLLLGTEESLYLLQFSRDGNSIVSTKKIDDFSMSGVADIIDCNDGGNLLLSKDEGIFYLKISSDYADFELSVVDDNSDGILDNLESGICDSKGTLWLTSMGNGVIRYSKDGENRFIRDDIISTTNGLVSNDVKTVFEDIEGNIWFGLFGQGLIRHVDNNLVTFNYGSDTESSRVFSLTGKDDVLYTIQGSRLVIISQKGDSIISTHALPGNLNNDKVNCTYIADNGVIWIGFEKSGLYYSDNERYTLKHMFLSNDDLSNSVNHITGNTTDLWVSTKRGACRINMNDGNKKWFTSDNGLPHNNIQHLYIDSRERVLISTQCSDIYYINENDEVVVMEKSRIGSLSSVISILEAADGTIFASTLGNGVWRIMEEGNLNFTRNSGLVSDFCYSMTTGENGKIVISHRGGLSQIDPITNRIKIYGRLEGIKSSMEFYQNAVYNNQGSIWFGTSEGILKYRSTLSAGGDIPPRLKVTGLSVNGETMDQDSLILLKSGQYEIVVDYIGINFTNPEMVRYQTKLEGYSTKWSDFTANRQVVYDRVGHGKYQFKIRAFNENDIGTEISSGFELYIKKPIFLSLWFYIIILVSIGLVFYLIIWIRERNLRSEQEKLLRNLDEKTKDIIVKEEIIKERKKVELELREAKTKAELSEQLKSSFLSNMSHEIRTPMNAIVGMSYLLKDEAFDSEERDKLINEIISNSENLLSLIADIMDVSKLETEQLTVNRESCDVNGLMHKLQTKFSGELQKHNKAYIKFICQTPEKSIEFTTDTTRLEQIMAKLLDNAVKYTEKGKITFGYEIDINRENIIFYVEDTGIGLSEEKKGFVFELFRKIEDDKLKLYRGTGLGLTLARYLVKILGGDINVESIKDKGSKFYFVLPLIMPEENVPVEDTSQTEALHQPYWIDKKILIVEDDDVNFQLLIYMLKDTGIEIIRSSNGEEAIETYFKDGTFDLIVMDIKLPGIDGYEATRRIRDKDQLIPIIAHTAYAFEGNKEESIKAGCNEYITKPINRASFLGIIARYLIPTGDETR